MNFRYKTLILGSALLFPVALTTHPAEAARCNPNGICRACSTCEHCAHCSGGGGRCSVCAGNNFQAPQTTQPRTTNNFQPSRVTRKTNRSTPSSSSANQIAAYTRQQAAESQRQAAIRHQNDREVAAWYANQPYTARCIAVSDGDTIKVLRDRKQIRIRLYGIDAPEKAQAFGQQSKNFLSAAAFNKTVKVFPKGTDRYGRTLAWIFVDNRCINRDLVAGGLAWHYAQYAPQEAKLAALQSSAKARKTGLWSMTATAPWAWRRAN